MRDADALRIAKQAVKLSRTFWQLDPLWEIMVELDHLEPETLAQVDYHPDYKRATIRVDPWQCRDEAAIWQHAAHEVAHLALWEHGAFKNILAAHCGGELPPVLDSAWDHMVESQTRRLEFAFVRAHPYRKGK